MFSRQSLHAKALSTTVLIAASLALYSCGGGNGNDDGDEAPSSGYLSEVTVTQYGIPHIKAEDWGSLGYGYGYHFASDNLCVLARYLLKVRGEQAAYFGIEGEEQGNFPSDVLSTYFMSDARMQQIWPTQDKRLRRLALGYAAGYNRYIQEIPPGRHESCRSEPWVRAMEKLDTMRLVSYISNLAALSNPLIAQAILAARPNFDTGALPTEIPGSAIDPQNNLWNTGMGSNAWGLGPRATQTGRPILFGNPHYPWHGDRRFYQAHMEIPGELNVMGAAIFGSPMVNIGFNENLAWTHTVSNAARFSLFELQLNPDNPLEYLFDGVWLPFRAEQVHIQVLDRSGNLSLQEQTLYFTEFGIVVDLGDAMGGTTWMRWPNPDGKAYALREVALGNDRLGAQMLEMVTAADLDTFTSSLKDNLGLTFINTIAAGKKGYVYYGDISTIPYITKELLRDCRAGNIGRQIGAALSAARADKRSIPVLDGTRSSCQWLISDKSPEPGLIPSEMLAELRNNTYVSNSNDSYWLTNLDTPITGKLPVMGGENYRISLRSQIGLSMIDDRLKGTDGKDVRKRFSTENLKDIALFARNGAGERFFSDISRLCTEREAAKSPSVRRGCSALNRWQLSNELDDAGGMFFNRIWERISSRPNLFLIPFNPQRPLDTPRYLGLQSDNEDANRELQSTILQAISDELEFFESHGLNPAAPLRDLQYVVRNGKRIPIRGGPPGTGSFNMIVPVFNGSEGWSEVQHGNSYIQIVTWDAEGQVRAEGILTYSQSTDPANPHYSDQTELYSEGGWIQMPFSPEDIELQKIATYSLASP